MAREMWQKRREVLLYVRRLFLKYTWQQHIKSQLKHIRHMLNNIKLRKTQIFFQIYYFWISFTGHISHQSNSYEKKITQFSFRNIFFGIKIVFDLKFWHVWWKKIWNRSCDFFLDWIIRKIRFHNSVGIEANNFLQ